MHSEDKREGIFKYEAYAPQQGHTEEEKLEFMETKEDNYDQNPDNVRILMRDFNARIGKDRTGIHDITGLFEEEMKNVGENLIDFNVKNNLKITISFLNHKENHRYTRCRWNQLTLQFDQRSIIDYMLTS